MKNIIILVIASLSVFEFTVCQNTPNRPQTPIPPFPYEEKEVKFRNEKANIELVGLLTYKKNLKPKACVVLAHGSGGNDRNDFFAGHKTFMVIADHLTRNNIAVLRYDERGIGESTGSFTEARDTDFSDDVLAGFDFMRKHKQFQNCKFGVVGHSKGGLTAMLAANSSKLVSFIVLLGSPGVSPLKIFLKQDREINKFYNRTAEQIDAIVKFNTMAYDIVIKNEDRNKTYEELVLLVEKYAPEVYKKEAKRRIITYCTPWYKDALLFEPRDVLKQIKIPVLGLWGTLDIIVSPDENLQGVKEALISGGNYKFLLKKLKGLNHQFQHTVTGSPTEYELNEETFSPDVLKIVSTWIKFWTFF